MSGASTTNGSSTLRCVRVDVDHLAELHGVEGAVENRTTVIVSIGGHQLRREHSVPDATDLGEHARRRVRWVRLEAEPLGVGGRPCHRGLTHDQLPG
jgi:hypothetical protein